MIDVTKISKTYEVRILGDEDLDSLLELCQGNTMFNYYIKTEPIKELLQIDMRECPEGAELEDKYYMGFFKNGIIVAIMEYIDEYPDDNARCLEFFMVDMSLQGKGIGTSIIQEVLSYLKSIGRTRVVSIVVTDNPQSSYFWKKNGFTHVCSGEIDDMTANVVEKIL